MSVIHFDAAELGNVAAWLGSHSRYSRTTDLARIVMNLATYSLGNTWAFNRTYNDNALPLTTNEIAVAACEAARNGVDAEKARGTLTLLSYNGVSNAGAEWGKPAYYEALCALMTAAYKCVGDEQDERARMLAALRR